MPDTRRALKPSETSRAPRVQRSGYFTAPNGEAIVEVAIDNIYTALMPVSVAEETAKRLQRAVDRIRKDA